MILTCPRCATRYLVQADQLWTTGRTVQCDACGQQWRAEGTGDRPSPPTPPPPEAVPEPAPPAEPPPSPVAPERDPEPEPAPEPEVESEIASPPHETEYPPVPGFASLESESAAAPATAEDPPLLFRPSPKRPAVRARSPWFGPVLSILFLLGMAVAVMLLFQDAVVHAFPGMAGVYSTLGLSKLSLTGGGHG